MRIKIFFSLMLISLSCLAQDNISKNFPGIDRYMDSLISQWQIPGMAVGIVHKDKLVYKKGFGFRDAARRLKVDAQTNFPIASNTKLFTSILAAMMQEEGKLDLDKPVKYYMPDLTFYTDELNAKVSLRDMLSHRTGLPGYDALWIGGNISRDSMMLKIKNIKPRYALREDYIYNNVMYSTAGVILEKISGERWEDLVRKKLFQPLNMSRSGFSDTDDRTSNYSLSYLEADSNGVFPQRMYSSQSEALGPAGTIFSSVEDMSKWMIALLNDGNYMGRQIIPASAIQETMKPLILSDKSGRWDELTNMIYCMGRSITAYKGIKMWVHTGSIDGFYSQLAFLPGKDLAIFVIGNGATSGNLRSTMAYPIIDRLLDLERTDWSGRVRKEYEEAKARNAASQASRGTSRIEGTKPSLNLSEYVGKYTHTMLGDVEISLKNDSLYFSYRDLNSSLHHYHFDQFITRQPPGTPDFSVNFMINNEGKADAFRMGVYGETGVFDRVKYR